MAAGDSSTNDYVIIHEIYENEDSTDDFEYELERALEEKVNIIIIEPTKLGDETAKWITVGNCLHKTAVLAGLTSLTIGGIYPKYGLVYYPLGFASLICAGVYAASWQSDPCCKYQVECNSRNLQKLPIHNLSSSSPVVLIRRDDSRRKVLHNTIALLAGSYCIWRCFRLGEVLRGH